MRWKFWYESIISASASATYNNFSSGVFERHVDLDVGGRDSFYTEMLVNAYHPKIDIFF